MNSNIGGFFVINLLTHRIIKEHKHYKTALNQWRKLGTTTHAIKPIADREAYYAHHRAVDIVSTNFSQTS